MSRIYIAGPMTGIPQFNFPAFKEVKELFDARGWEVYCPAHTFTTTTGFDASKCSHGTTEEVLAQIPDFNYRTRMLQCLAMVAKCEYIHLLSGWEHSKGAKAEYALAQALNLWTVSY